MTNETLQYAINLQKLIITTTGSLEALQKWLDDTKVRSPGSAPTTSKDDTNYNFHLCEYSDGSGHAVKLNRIFHNRRLLLAIQKELQEQLAELEAEFAALH
jgi:hypothetical protein